MAQKALDFNSAGDIVTVPAHASIANIFDGGGSVEAWIKPNSDGGGGRVAEKVAAIGWFLGIGWGSGGASRLTCLQHFTINDGGWYTTARGIPNGTWSYVVMTYDSSNINNDPILYVNGVSLAVFENKIPNGSTVDDSAEDLAIGNRADQARTFDGIIDEIRFSTKIRTPAEISAIWNGGNGKRFEVDGDTVALWHMDEGADSTIYDETNNNNDGTIDGASWVDGYPFIFPQFLSLVSILSAEAFGALTVVPGAVSILPAAIASLEAFGTAKLNLKLILTAIASAEAFGMPIVTSGLTIYPSAIPSAEAFGSLVVAGPLIVPGIGSQEAFGSLTVSPGGVSVAPSGISSQELFGLPKLNLLLTPSGIVSSEAFGAAKLNLKLILTAIASGEQFGTPTVKMILVIRPSGIASVEAFGTPLLIVILAGGDGLRLPTTKGQVSIPSGQVSIPSKEVSI